MDKVQRRALGFAVWVSGAEQPLPTRGSTAEAIPSMVASYATQTRGRLCVQMDNKSRNVHQPLMSQFGKNEHHVGPVPHAFPPARR